MAQGKKWTNFWQIIWLQICCFIRQFFWCK